MQITENNFSPANTHLYVGAGRVTSSRESRDVYGRNLTDIKVANFELATGEDVDRAVKIAKDDSKLWSHKSFEERCEILYKVAAKMQERRADLLRAAAINTGKPFCQTDAEVSEAIDFARLYGLSAYQFAKSLENIEIRPKGTGVTVIVSPWNFSIAIPSGGVLAALAAGNRVILKSSSSSLMSTYEAAKCFWDAGVPREVFQFLPCDNATATYLTSHEDVSSVIFTGSTKTADVLVKAKPSLDLFAETGGKNAMILTDKCDRELAIKHIVSSYTSNGQKCSATSIVLLFEGVYNDDLFWAQLKDAVESVEVGYGWDPKSVVSPLIHEPKDTLLKALTELDEGEEWVVQPKQVDGRSDYWTPGLKKGSKRGSMMHMEELFGPVITVMNVKNMDEALEIVHETEKGLTFGIHTLDDREYEYAIEKVQAGVIYRNSGTTGAIANRQTFGGWRDSRRGPGLHAGSENYVTNFMDYYENVEGMTDEQIFGVAMESYNKWFNDYFSKEHRPAQDVRGQDNIHRYRPIDKVLIRVSQKDGLWTVPARVHASKLCGNSTILSLPVEMNGSQAVIDLRTKYLEVFNDIEIVYESDDGLIEKIRMKEIDQIRYSHPDLVPAVIYQAAAEVPHVYISRQPVVTNGRIELLRYLQEQTISNTYHRYGGQLKSKDLN